MKPVEKGWLGIPDFNPAFSLDKEEVATWCVPIDQAVRGQALMKVFAAYDLRHDCWNLDLPMLLQTAGHCIDVMNFKLDEVTVGIGRISPLAPIIQTWEEWVLEWREYPCTQATGKAIHSIEPTIEDEERNMNHGCLNGIRVGFDDGELLIQNGLDTNLLWWVNAEGSRTCLGNGND